MAAEKPAKTGDRRRAEGGAKKPVPIMLTESDKLLLDRCAESWGISRPQAVSRLIRFAHKIDFLIRLNEITVNEIRKISPVFAKQIKELLNELEQVRAKSYEKLINDPEAQRVRDAVKLHGEANTKWAKDLKIQHKITDKEHFEREKILPVKQQIACAEHLINDFKVRGLPKNLHQQALQDSWAVCRPVGNPSKPIYGLKGAVYAPALKAWLVPQTEIETALQNNNGMDFWLTSISFYKDYEEKYSLSPDQQRRLLDTLTEIKTLYSVLDELEKSAQQPQAADVS